MKRTLLIHGSILLFIFILAISPLLAAGAAGAVANHFGCDLDEGSIHPCQGFGRDIGGTLYSLGVLGWLSLATIPLGLTAMGVYLAILLIFLVIRRVARSRMPQV